MLHLDAGPKGCFEGVFSDNGRGSEDVIDAKTARLMCFHMFAYLVGGKTRPILTLPRLLTWRIVRHLGLVENNASTVPIPDCLVRLSVLHKQTVDCDVVALDPQASGAGVFRPANISAVVGPPELQVVTDDIVIIDRDHALRPAGPVSTHTTENVVHTNRVLSPVYTPVGAADL